MEKRSVTALLKKLFNKKFRMSLDKMLIGIRALQEEGNALKEISEILNCNLHSFYKYMARNRTESYYEISNSFINFSIELDGVGNSTWHSLWNVVRK